MLSCNSYYSGKAISILRSECVFVALVIQRAMRMRHIAICGLPRSTVFSPRYLINGRIFGKKLLNTKCVFWFSLEILSEIFLILRRNERDLIINVAISQPIRSTVIFSLETLGKNNGERILILVIYWKNTGLLHNKISNHNITIFKVVFTISW